MLGRRPDAVGDAAEHNRAERHADELHREHNTQCGAIDAPFGGDSGRGEGY